MQICAKIVYFWLHLSLTGRIQL